MGLPYKNYAYDSKFHWVNNIAKDCGYNPVASTLGQEVNILAITVLGDFNVSAIYFTLLATCM